jgi:TPP-dependent 2-oxoacid decarboxylase
MGKGAVNERHKLFGGLYVGALSKRDVKQVVETSDCVFWMGNYPVSDFWAKYDVKQDQLTIIL